MSTAASQSSGTCAILNKDKTQFLSEITEEVSVSTESPCQGRQDSCVCLRKDIAFRMGFGTLGALCDGRLPRSQGFFR